ncbi:MAG TPA: hypothetical protein VIB79_29520 [Candidatus Binatia bacterium]|jgi:hypothetical protein
MNSANLVRTLEPMRNVKVRHTRESILSIAKGDYPVGQGLR